MAQSPWEASRFSVSQEIPRILWNPKFFYGPYELSMILADNDDNDDDKNNRFSLFDNNTSFKSTKYMCKF